MKDTRSLLFLFLSLGLMGTWVYHFYDKTQYSLQKPGLSIRDSMTLVKTIQDSIQKIYALKIEKLNALLDSTITKTNFLNEELHNNMLEKTRLKTGVADIPITQHIKKEESKLLVKNNLPVHIQSKSMKASLVKVNEPPTFLASNIKLLPLSVKNDTEQENGFADQINKIHISFTVKNNEITTKDAELFVIITQPDGKVIKSDIWEDYTINTRHEGKKQYTRQLKFIYEKAENKQLSFSVNATNYLAGNYTVQVYQHGYKIGQSSKILK